jgi:hypothetical protein
MQQNINLYQLLPKKVKSRFTWNTLGFVYGAFIFLLMIQFVHALLEEHRLTKEYGKAIISLDYTKQRFQKLIAQYPSIDTKNIQTIADSMRAELNNELKIIQLLTGSSKFSFYLQGLSEATVPNVWLTDILFATKEPYIVLQGNALQALFAQQYLDQLMQQSIFNALPFRINELKESILNKSAIFTFNMSTKMKSQP